MIKNNHKGETIVEVLIVIAIIGAIIAGSYAIASRSLTRVRIAQERSEALKLAEGQMEVIRSKSDSAVTLSELCNKLIVTKDVSSSCSGAGKSFCIQTSNAYIGKPFIMNIEPADSLSSYPSQCKNGLFNIIITSANSEVSTNDPNRPINQITYNVLVSWEKLGGGAIEQVSIYDRVNVR